MKISKIRNVLSPNRGTEFSAGIDFYIPEFNKEFLNDLFNRNELFNNLIENALINKNITLFPNQRILIPSGIKVNFEGEPKVLIAYNKSGIATKKGLDALACVVDQDYQGEIHLSLVNSSYENIIISENEKIIQFILMPVFYDNIIEVSENDLWKNETERGDGGFGSTNYEKRISTKKWRPNEEVVRCQKDNGQWELRQPNLSVEGFIEKIRNNKRKAYICGKADENGKLEYIIKDE